MENELTAMEKYRIITQYGNYSLVKEYDRLKMEKEKDIDFVKSIINSLSLGLAEEMIKNGVELVDKNKESVKVYVKWPAEWDIGTKTGSVGLKSDVKISEDLQSLFLNMASQISLKEEEIKQKEVELERMDEFKNKVYSLARELKCNKFLEKLEEEDENGK